MGARGARPPSQPRATAIPARAAGAASCCPRGVGAPVVAARLRVGTRLGLDAVGRLLARRRSLPATPRQAHAARVGPGRLPVRA